MEYFLHGTLFRIPRYLTDLGKGVIPSSQTTGSLNNCFKLVVFSLLRYIRYPIYVKDITSVIIV